MKINIYKKDLKINSYLIFIISPTGILVLGSQTDLASRVLMIEVESSLVSRDSVVTAIEIFP
jgi:hypothetical protein